MVSYHAALSHAHNGDRERLKKRALEMLDVVAVKFELECDEELTAMLEEARRSVRSD